MKFTFGADDKPNQKPQHEEEKSSEECSNDDSKITCDASSESSSEETPKVGTKIAQDIEDKMKAISKPAPPHPWHGSHDGRQPFLKAGEVTVVLRPALNDELCSSLTGVILHGKVGACLSGVDTTGQRIHAKIGHNMKLYDSCDETCGNCRDTGVTLQPEVCTRQTVAYKSENGQVIEKEFDAVLYRGVGGRFQERFHGGPAIFGGMVLLFLAALVYYRGKKVQQKVLERIAVMRSSAPKYEQVTVSEKVCTVDVGI